MIEIIKKMFCLRGFKKKKKRFVYSFEQIKDSGNQRWANGFGPTYNLRNPQLVWYMDANFFHQFNLQDFQLDP